MLSAQKLNPVATQGEDNVKMGYEKYLCFIYWHFFGACKLVFHYQNIMTALHTVIKILIPLRFQSLSHLILRWRFAFRAFQLTHLHTFGQGTHFWEKHKALFPFVLQFLPLPVHHSPFPTQSKDSITTL